MEGGDSNVCASTMANLGLFLLYVAPVVNMPISPAISRGGGTWGVLTPNPSRSATDKPLVLFGSKIPGAMVGANYP